jgi:hypothetical protein
VKEKFYDDEIPNNIIVQNTVKAKQENSSKTRTIFNSEFPSKSLDSNYPILSNRINIKSSFFK